MGTPNGYNASEVLQSSPEEKTKLQIGKFSTAELIIHFFLTNDQIIQYHVKLHLFFMLMKSAGVSFFPKLYL